MSQMRVFLGRVRRLARDPRRLLRVTARISARMGTRYRQERRRLRALRRVARKELEWDVPLRLRRPRWWLKGFLSRSVVLYGLEDHDPSGYVTDVQRYASTKFMVHPHLQDLIDNKFTAGLLLHATGLGITTSELLGVYWRGGVHSFPKEDRTPLREYLQSHMSVNQTVFFKPLKGAEGKKILAVTRTADGFILNNRPTTLPVVRKTIEEYNRPLVIELGVKQHPVQAKLYPGTTNTLRVLTMLDMRTRAPFVPIAVQRIGSDRSSPVDNWTAGGLSAEIDLETGKLGKATRLPDGNELVWYATHPDSGATIEGVDVPFWTETRRAVLHAARALSFMEYMGWDIVMTSDGPVFLEANINSGLNVLQVHKPLLSDPRAHAYFAKRGVVKPLTTVDPDVADARSDDALDSPPIEP